MCIYIVNYGFGQMIKLKVESNWNKKKEQIDISNLTSKYIAVN